MSETVYVFAGIKDDEESKEIVKQIKEGKAQYWMGGKVGWREVSLRKEPYGKNKMLLEIKPRDWIVFLNTPSYGKCTAMRVTSEYDFDEGIDCSHRGCGPKRDYNNFFEIDTGTIIKFDRENPNVHESTRKKLKSIQKTPCKLLGGDKKIELGTKDFLKSMENLKKK